MRGVVEVLDVISSRADAVVVNCRPTRSMLPRDAGAVFVPYLSVPGAENGISVLSASKAWNLAGLKAALVIAGPAAAEDHCGLRRPGRR